MADRDLLLETILHYVPRMERNNVKEQHAFFINSIKEKMKKGEKFILEYDDLKTLVSVIFLYRHVIAPLEHAKDFYFRMLQLGVSSTSLGKYSLDEKNSDMNAQIVNQFYGMLKDFFKGKGMQDWEGILGIETTLDFERILKVR